VWILTFYLFLKKRKKNKKSVNVVGLKKNVKKKKGLLQPSPTTSLDPMVARKLAILASTDNLRRQLEGSKISHPSLLDWEQRRDNE
jgi:hypothetical protein